MLGINILSNNSVLSDNFSGNFSNNDVYAEGHDKYKNDGDWHGDKKHDDKHKDDDYSGKKHADCDDRGQEHGKYDHHDDKPHDSGDCKDYCDSSDHLSDLHGVLACLPDACSVIECAIGHLDCEAPTDMGCFDNHDCHDTCAA